MKTLKQLVEEQTLTVGIAEVPSDLSTGLALTEQQEREAVDANPSRELPPEPDNEDEYPGYIGSGVDAVIREVARERGLYEEAKLPEFPFPGARILSLWVGEQVKVQLQLGASTDEILNVVRQVLDDNDKKHGPRPLAALDGGER